MIDGTLRRSCRPTDVELQREIYDGHHRDHGLAFQCVQLPNGFIMDMFGPVSGRRHDATVLRLSRLNARLAAAQHDELRQYSVYGDSAYPVLSHVRRGFKGSNLTPGQREHNRQMSSVRISVEWSFGKIVQLWGFVDYRKNLKLLLQPIGLYYMNAAILTNAHTCLYGSLTGERMDVRQLSLNQYFGSS